MIMRFDFKLAADRSLQASTRARGSPYIWRRCFETVGTIFTISPLHRQVSILPLQLNQSSPQTLLSFQIQVSQPFPPFLLRRITPHLEQLTNAKNLNQQQFSSSSSSSLKYKEHFIDLSTGIRFHYLSWPRTSDDVILLLHDIAHSSSTWIEIGTKLYNRGYTVFALDLRGHGGTDSSSSKNYSASHLAEDIHAFIIAKDLYIRPVAVVGCGNGGAVALTLANKAPNLIGAVACLDFGLPPALLLSENSNTAKNNDTKSHPSVHSNSSSSAELLPWWSFWLGQGLKFKSPTYCAAFLMSPLTQVGPAVFSNLLSSTAKEDTDSIKHILDRLTRSPDAAAQDAVSMLRPVAIGSTTTQKSKYFEERFPDDDFPAEFEINMDATFFFSFDIETIKRGMCSLKAHLLVLHGERSAIVPAEDAVTLATLAEPTAASVTVVEIPQTGHYLVSDSPNDVYTALCEFLEGPAVSCFNIEQKRLDSSCGGNKNCDESSRNRRRPEVLGIRPLPEYASIEEAKKALGPRSIPTAEAIDEELRKLRLEEREAPGAGAGGDTFSDDEEENNGGGGSDDRTRKTALSHDPSDYFGFVG
jgi:pimeloyl-ACP methyl ester carboxylesterase